MEGRWRGGGWGDCLPADGIDLCLLELEQREFVERHVPEGVAIRGRWGEMGRGEEVRARREVE